MLVTGVGRILRTGEIVRTGVKGSKRGREESLGEEVSKKTSKGKGTRETRSKGYGHQNKDKCQVDKDLDLRSETASTEDLKGRWITNSGKPTGCTRRLPDTGFK